MRIFIKGMLYFFGLEKPNKKTRKMTEMQLLLIG